MCFNVSALRMVAGQNRAHASGVRSFVVVEGPFVVLGRDERKHVVSVGQREEGDLVSLQELLEHEPRARTSELPVLDEALGHRQGLGFRIDDDDAFAAREAVRLDHQGQTDLAAIDDRLRLLHAAHDVVAGGRNLVTLEEVFREGLAAFELRRGAGRSEDREASPLELVDETEYQGQLGPDHGEPDRELLREVRELDDIGRVDRDAVGEKSDARVAGSAEDLRYLRALAELPDESVLPPSSADDENPQAGPRSSLFGAAKVKVNALSKLALLLKPGDYPIVASWVSTALEARESV